MQVSRFLRSVGYRWTRKPMQWAGKRGSWAAVAAATAVLATAVVLLARQDHERAQSISLLLKPARVAQVSLPPSPSLPPFLPQSMSLFLKPARVAQFRAEHERVAAARRALQSQLHLQARAGKDLEEIERRILKARQHKNEGRTEGMAGAANVKGGTMLRRRNYAQAAGAVSFRNAGEDGGRDKTTASVAEECLPPRALIKGKCIRDPRGDKPPKFCLRKPFHSTCRKWRKKEKAK